MLLSSESFTYITPFFSCSFVSPFFFMLPFSICFVSVQICLSSWLKQCYSTIALTYVLSFIRLGNIFTLIICLCYFNVSFLHLEFACTSHKYIPFSHQSALEIAAPSMFIFFLLMHTCHRCMRQSSPSKNIVNFFIIHVSVSACRLTSSVPAAIRLIHICHTFYLCSDDLNIFHFSAEHSPGFRYLCS